MGGYTKRYYYGLWNTKSKDYESYDVTKSVSVWQQLWRCNMAKGKINDDGTSCRYPGLSLSYLRLETYPRGKPIDISDKYACKEQDGSWTCGECVTKELNTSKLRVLGPQHPDVKAFIAKEDNNCKKWNITLKEWIGI